MRSVVFYFQVHQPWRLRHFTFFDIGAGQEWFDDAENARIVRRVAQKCYLPMNRQMLECIKASGKRFRIAYSISGAALDQFERWVPEVIESFQALAKTGCVEFLGETSHHSLSALVSLEEFDRQVLAQADRIEKLFGRRPTTFRNTELVITNEIARRAEELGFTAILGEGADQLLGWRSPHRVYRPEGCERIKLLLRSYKFSDDIAFRFSNKEWPEYPLSPERFAGWLAALGSRERFVGLFMDYETFGEHQWEETGIFRFMQKLPAACLATGALQFRTPSEVATELDPVARLDIPRPISWADAERDLTAWLGNPMQKAAHEALYGLLPAVRRLTDAGDGGPYAKWQRLSTSDHVYYMCTKWFSDGDVHKYFSPYATPHDAFISFMNVFDDLSREVRSGLAALSTSQADRPREKRSQPRAKPASGKATGSKRARKPRKAPSAPRAKAAAPKSSPKKPRSAPARPGRRKSKP
ncbi:MAG: glycoside hydrolase family 57 protein [Planctomycetota bacterium]|nr:glycoside hydrolase family 57 protein [Planctomycetota bacterium]